MSDKKLPTISSTVSVDIPEHQILLDFNSDEQALSFHDWYWDKGASLFLEWLEDQDSNNP